MLPKAPGDGCKRLFSNKMMTSQKNASEVKLGAALTPKRLPSKMDVRAMISRNLLEQGNVASKRCLLCSCYIFKVLGWLFLDHFVEKAGADHELHQTTHLDLEPPEATTGTPVPVRKNCSGKHGGGDGRSRWIYRIILKKLKK